MNNPETFLRLLQLSPSLRTARRHVLKIAASECSGLTLNKLGRRGQMEAQKIKAPPARAKSVIFLYQFGGPPTSTCSI